ncbi:hypothetical protein [Chitinimonas sp. BJB300]|nr:hypothetical protein [Chitinimonas sp. BJB300]
MMMLAALSLSLAACGEKPRETWIAGKDIPAYKAVNDDLRTPAFIIKSGETCQAGETSFGKVDAYTHVICTSGTGWVTESEHFKKSSDND